MPEQAVTASTVLLLLGGASFLLGLKPKIGTAAIIPIIAFLASVSPMMHDFWTQQDHTAKRQNDMIHFSKNMALGAAIALVGMDEPWPASVPLLKVIGLDAATSGVREKR